MFFELAFGAENSPGNGGLGATEDFGGLGVAAFFVVNERHGASPIVG